MMMLYTTSKIKHKIRCTRKHTLNLSVKAKFPHVNLCNRPLVSICGENTLELCLRKAHLDSYKQIFVKILYHYQHVASSVCSTVVHDHETFMRLAMNDGYKYGPHPTPIRHLYDVINFYLPSLFPAIAHATYYCVV